MAISSGLTFILSPIPADDQPAEDTGGADYRKDAGGGNRADAEPGGIRHNVHHKAELTVTAQNVNCCQHPELSGADGLLGR